MRVLLCLSGLGFFVLTHLVALTRRSTWLELGVGALCVLAGVSDMPMLLFGRGLFAPVSVPTRSWHSASGYVDEY